MITKNISRKSEFQMIDVFKFIMSFVVVAFHTNPLADSQNELWMRLFIMVADLAVPFFYISSGFFLKENKLDSYLVKILKMYCVWTLLSFPLTIYGYMLSGNGIVSCILSYIKYFLFVGKLYNSYHLYYLLALIYAVVIIKVLLKMNKPKWLFGVAFILYSMNMFMQHAGEYIDNGGILNKIINVYQFVFNKGGVFTGMIYIVIGMIIARRKIIINKPFCILGIIACEIFKVYLGDIADAYILILESALFFQIIVGISVLKLNYTVYLRQLSTVIYLVHLIVFSFYTILIIHQPNVLGAKSFLVTAIFSLAIAVLLRKLEKKERFKWIGNFI